MKLEISRARGAQWTRRLYEEIQTGSRAQTGGVTKQVSVGRGQ